MKLPRRGLLHLAAGALALPAARAQAYPARPVHLIVGFPPGGAGDIEMMPYMHPKLAVTALVQEGDFATLLEQRIRRFNEAKMIEHKPQVIESKPPMPRVADKRFRRI
jgi:hypothetical protein